MIHEDLPTLTETAFGSPPCCVVSVTYVSLYNLAQQWLACSQALDVGCDSIGNVTE
jgi:hypothetical protein